MPYKQSPDRPIRLEGSRAYEAWPTHFDSKSWTAGSAWSPSTCPTRRSTRSRRRSAGAGGPGRPSSSSGPTCAGCLFKSGKPGQFIAGADLNELAMMSYAKLEQVAGLTDFGHQLFNRISRLPFPTVALIDGNCMGGGTELVLSMDERLVSTAPHTQIGLPEVKLGLLPGWGGTQRLPRLIGLNAGDRDDLLGRAGLGAEGRRAGLRLRRGPGREAGRGRAPADRVPAAERRVEGAARAAASSRSGSIADQLNFAFAVAEGAIKGKTKGQYPAPLVALKAIREGCNLPLEEGPEGRAEGGRRAGRLADLGQPDRHLLHEEPAGARPGRERPVRQAAAGASASACSGPG